MRNSLLIGIGFALVLPWAAFAEGPTYGLYTQTRTAGDAGSEDRFGTSVALEGDTLVVGGPLNNDTFSNSGSAYVFGRDQGGAENWGQRRELHASDPFESDNFGFSVDVDGDFIIVGAPYNDDQGSNSGSAYIFSRNQGGSGNWGQVAKLTNTTGTAGDEFGFDVAIDGDTAVVGAPADNSDRGSITVFSRNQGGAGNWGQVTTLTASDATNGDLFGFSVDIDGNDIVIGAREENSSGAIYVFSLSGTWTQKKQRRGEAGGDDFGQSVAIDGGRILVGAPRVSTEKGAAYIFERNQPFASQWGQVRKLTASDIATNDEFGYAVALHGRVALVGARFEDGPSNSGSAYLFDQDVGGSGNWGQSEKIKGNNPSSSDATGTAVALINDTAALGAPLEDLAAGNAGAVYLYDVFFNQTPVIGNQAFSITENSSNMTVVGTVVASDPDVGQSLSYQIATDPSSGAFDLNPTNGVLTVLDSNKVDHESFQQVVLTVRVVDDGTPAITNSATVTVNILNVVEGADLLVIKTAVPALSTTSNLSYTIQVSNLGPTTATNVVVVDTLPQGVVYNPIGSSPGCTESNGVVTCNLGDVTGSSNAVINVVVATNTVGVITNLAVATTTTLEDGSINNNFGFALTDITDFDNDLDPDFHDPDDDNDIMPDLWEIQFGLNPTNASDAAAFADTDSFTNLEEYISDTDPTDELSYLKFETITGPPLMLGFQSSTGRLYTIESKTNLLNEAWTPVSGLSNFFGVGGADIRTNSMLVPQRDYRLDVRLPTP